MPRPRNRIVMYLEEHGPATPSEISKALGHARTTSTASEMLRLKRAGRIGIVGQKTTGSGQVANLWDVCDPCNIRRPDTQEIVTAALASQPALATVWRAA